MDLTELKQTRFHYLQNADSKEIQIVFEIQIGLVQCEHSQKEWKI